MQKHFHDHDSEFFVDSSGTQTEFDSVEPPYRRNANAANPHYSRHVPSEWVEAESDILLESDRVEPPYRFHDHAPNPHYYHNAHGYYDESQISTKSSSSSGVTHQSSHSTRHSPGQTFDADNRRHHANDGSYPNQAAWHEGEDKREPAEESEYRERNSNMVSNVPVNVQEGARQGDFPSPHAMQGHQSQYHNANQHSGFVPHHVPNDVPPPGYHHPSHYANYPDGRRQPSFSHFTYATNYQGQPQNYTPHPPHFQHNAQGNNSGYYYHEAIPDNYRTSQANPGAVPNERASQSDESTAKPAQLVAEYNERDILCGRGALMIWHPGNQFFRRLVQTHRQRYFFSRRQEKKRIASQIMDEVKAHGGRFLRRSQASDNLDQINVWIEIDEERAYQKTCQALREGAPEIRRQWRSNPSSSDNNRSDGEENVDDAASK